MGRGNAGIERGKWTALLVHNGGHGPCGTPSIKSWMILNERHLKRLIAEYILYYHADRTHRVVRQS
jgi:hypothetical protein